jgi:hypothetical protein
LDLVRKNSIISQNKNNCIGMLNQALHQAIISKNQTLADELLTEGADPNYILPATNNSMLFLCLTYGLGAVASKMLDMNLQSKTVQLTVLFLLNAKQEVTVPS